MNPQPYLQGLQNIQNLPRNYRPAQRNTFYQDAMTPIYELKTSKSILFTNLTIKVYENRVSLEYRPFFGNTENRRTFSVVDIGDIYINKNRKRALVGAHHVNSGEILFEIKGLKHEEAEELKDALDAIMSYRFTTTVYQSRAFGSAFPLR